MMDEDEEPLLAFGTRSKPVTFADVRKRWESCGYTVTVTPTEEMAWRVGLLMPGRPAAVGQGPTRAEAMAHATVAELSRLPREMQKLWAGETGK